MKEKLGEEIRKINQNTYKATKYRGMQATEFIDSKSRKAKEFGSKKPYGNCYGSDSLITR